MAVGILFFKDDNTIHEFVNNVTGVGPNRIDYSDGYIEGFDGNVVEYVIVDSLVIGSYKREEINITYKDGQPIESFIEVDERCLLDYNDNVIKIGDKLPDSLVDLRNSFRKPDLLQQEQRIADLELMLAEMVGI